MAIGSFMRLGNLVIDASHWIDSLPMDRAASALSGGVLLLGLLAALLVWLCTDPSAADEEDDGYAEGGDGEPTEEAPRSRSGRKPGLQAADVVPGRTYKLRSAAMVRMGPELDSPQAPGGLLEKGSWLTVGRVKVLTRSESGTGEAVVRLCCADGRGWVSLRAKGGKDLFRARPRMATLQEADVEVGGSYRVRSMAAVRTGPDMLSPKAEVEFLKPVRPLRLLRSRPQA